MTITRTVQTDAHGRPVYSDWLIAATPGAAEALAAWEQAAADLAPLNAEVRRTIQAAAGLGQWNGTPGDAVYAKRPDVPTQVFEDAEKAKRDAQEALARAGRRVGALRKKFDDLMAGASADPDERKRLAAAHALKMQDEAVAAWKILKAAMNAREEAFSFAGTPGRSWRNRNGAGESPSLAKANAENLIQVFLDGFDVEAVRTVADGGQFDPEEAPHSQAVRSLKPKK